MSKNTQMRNILKNIKSKISNLSWWEIIISLIISLILGLIVGVIIQPYCQRQYFKLQEPAALQIINQHEIHLLNQHSELIDIIKLPNIMIDTAILIDINENDKKEIVIGTGEKGEKSGSILIYNKKGKMLWEYECYDKQIMDSLSGAHSKNFKISQIYVGPVFGGQNNYIIALAHDPKWFTTRLLVLDGKLYKLIYSFWHPGLVSDMIVVDQDNNDTLDVILSGVNNNLRQLFKTGADNIPVIFALSPKKELYIQAFPGGFPSLSVAPTLWYLVIPPTGVGLSSIVEDYDGDGKSDIRVEVEDGRFYYVNYKGELIGVGAGDLWKKNHPRSGIPIPLSIKYSNDEWQINQISENIQIKTYETGSMHLTKAINFYNRGEYDSAIVELKIAEEMNPDLDEVVKIWYIRASKKGKYGILGVQVENTTMGGALITTVVPHSPADNANLQKDDIIKGIDNVSISSSNELNLKLAQKNPGDKVILLIEREEQLFQISTTLVSVNSLEK